MSNNIFDPKITQMGDKVMSGVLFTGSSQAVKVLTQIISVVLLARLISPENFGIMAMTGPVFGFITLFTDLGFGQALTQKKEVTHDDVNALFWINFGVSLVVALIVIAVAPLAGAFYHEESVTYLLIAMSALILFGTLGSIHGAITYRRMEFGRLAVLDTIGAVGGLLASIAWTFVSPTFWALYVGMVVSSLLPVITLWLTVRWLPTKPGGFAQVKSLLHFGAGVTSFNVFNYLARNLDNVLIGQKWGGVPLGLYDRAYKLLLYPLQNVTGPLSKVMLPALSRLHGDPDRYRAAFNKALALTLLATVPAVALLLVSADVLIPFVLGDEWLGVIPIFKVLAICAFIQMLNNPTGWLFLSQARTKAMSIWGLVTAITSIIAFFIGLPYGPVGVAAAYAVSEYIRTPALWWLVTNNGRIKRRTVLGTVLPIYISVGIALALGHVVQPLLAGMSPFFSLPLYGLLVYGATVSAMMAFPKGRETLLSALNLGRGLSAKILRR